MVIEEKTLKIGNQHILYDASLAVSMTGLPYLFDSNYLQQHGKVTATATGRGTTYFYDWDEHKLVLRHYRRGGLIGKFNPEYYLNTKLEKTRPYQEWRLLCRLQELGLPAPRPAAMRILSGSLFYCADLVTHQLQDVIPLSQQLTAAPVEEGVWHALGALVRRFHELGVYHDDLNAHNILLGAAEHYLIDFDKGQIKQPGSWQQANLARLRRSLDKLKGLEAQFHFSEQDWQVLLTGYREGSGVD